MAPGIDVGLSNITAHFEERIATQGNMSSQQRFPSAMTSVLVVLCMLLPCPIDGAAFPSQMEPQGRKAFELDWNWNKDQYPNPQTDPERCMQKAASYVCDPDRKFSTDEAMRLNDLILRSQSSTTCLCEESCSDKDKGMVIGVAIMQKMYYPYHGNVGDEAHAFGKLLMEKWKLGTCGNGLLLIIATDAKIFHIETGEGVKNFLTDEKIAEILEQCKGHLNDGHYYQGVESIINSLQDSVQLILRSPAKQEGEEDTDTGSVGLTVGLVVGFAALAGLFAAGLVMVRKRRRNANNDKFMYEGSGARPGSRSSMEKKDIIGPIVKNPVVFPDAVYQPCSVEDSKGVKITQGRNGSDEEEEDERDNNEDQYLRNMEENPSYESANTMLQPRTLSDVAEEDPERSPTTVESPMEAVTMPIIGVHTANVPSQYRATQENHQNDGYA